MYILTCKLSNEADLFVKLISFLSKDKMVKYKNSKEKKVNLPAYRRNTARASVIFIFD
jgi:hypothetical protein